MVARLFPFCLYFIMYNPLKKYPWQQRVHGVAEVFWSGVPPAPIRYQTTPTPDSVGNRNKFKFIRLLPPYIMYRKTFANYFDFNFCFFYIQTVWGTI